MYSKTVWSESTEKLKIWSTPGKRVNTYMHINRNKQLANKNPITRTSHCKYNWTEKNVK